MPINTIQCTECGNRIHYSVDDFNTERSFVCNRCGAENYADADSISKYVADEIEAREEERTQEEQLRSTTFKPSFEGEDGMPKSNWTPGVTFMSEQTDEDLDKKLDSVKQKFKAARAELSDVGSTFTPSSAEELINRFTADDIDLSVKIPLEENNREENPSVIKRKALELVANRYLNGNVTQANNLYDFIVALYTACKEQKLNFKSIVADSDTVLDFAGRCGLSQNTLDLIENLYMSGDIDKIVGLLEKHLK